MRPLINDHHSIPNVFLCRNPWVGTRGLSYKACRRFPVEYDYGTRNIDFRPCLRSKFSYEPCQMFRLGLNVRRTISQVDETVQQIGGFFTTSDSYLRDDQAAHLFERNLDGRIWPYAVACQLPHLLLKTVPLIEIKLKAPDVTRIIYADEDYSIICVGKRQATLGLRQYRFASRKGPPVRTPFSSNCAFKHCESGS